jgi:pilus assembly protein CpaF
MPVFLPSGFPARSLARFGAFMLSLLELERSVRDELTANTTTLDRDSLKALLAQRVLQSFPLAAELQRKQYASDLLAELTGLGPLDQLLDDPDVDEVLVNAGAEVWVERRGVVARVGSLGPGKIDSLLERILSPLGRRADRLHPIVDARLADGSRVSAIVPPLAVDGTCLSIRRFRLQRVTLDAFANDDVEALLGELVERRLNIVVTGATSSGKTTLLNALASRIGVAERVVTVEDIAELRLVAEHVVRLECRPVTADGDGRVDMRDLVRAALRLRPDRLVVGEVRGAEALDMVQAMNTGHDGSMSTCHANSPLDGLRRLESMVLQASDAMPLGAIREQLHSSIDAIVHVQRLGDGARRVISVAEVCEDGSAERVRCLARGPLVVGEPKRQRHVPMSPISHALAELPGRGSSTMSPGDANGTT